MIEKISVADLGEAPPPPPPILENIYILVKIEAKIFFGFTHSKKPGSPLSSRSGSTTEYYLVSCKKCRLQYIGSTTTDFRVRFRNHKSAMITKKKTAHYHCTPKNVKVFIPMCEHGIWNKIPCKACGMVIHTNYIDSLHL